MQPRCKKCGRPLSSPESIARGMGPECAGISGSCGKSARVRRPRASRTIYSALSTNHVTMPLFAWAGDDNQEHVPEQLARFPSDLLDLVLSAPAAGTIAVCVKSHRRKRSKQKGQSPITTLKEIRRTCIEFRLLFWPGLSMNLEPIPCIPYGENDWKIGENGRVCSKIGRASCRERVYVLV